MTTQTVEDVLVLETEKMKYINGGRTRTRTLDPLIKSQLLCRDIIILPTRVRLAVLLCHDVRRRCAYR